MQIAQTVAGYSLGAADLLRRAMGKKKVEEMDAQREGFIAGSLKNGLNERQARELFDLLEKFAGYGLINLMQQRMRWSHTKQHI